MRENAVEEVREFLEQLPQRTPQEAIGMRDEGGLWQGMVLGAIGLAAVTLVATIIPFLMGAGETGESTAAATARAAPAEASQPNDATEPAGAENNAASSAKAPETGDVADPDKLLNNLGIGEAKEAAPDVNPRENDLDNLLDGVK